MRKRLVSINELSEIIGICAPTLRIYIDNYRFSKYVTRTKIEGQNNRYKLTIELSKQFAYKLSDYLRARHKLEAIDKLADYFEEFENGSK